MEESEDPWETYTPDLVEIMRQLDAGKQGDFPEVALRMSQRHREEITPHLIEAIRSATERARNGDIAEGNAHFFAAYLLTEFQAKEALPVFLDAMRLPGKAVDELFQDAVTELFSRMLALFAEDQPALVDELIDDRSNFEYVRWAAADVYEFWVTGGKMSREEAVERLRGHLRTAIERRDATSPGFLIYAVTDLVPPSQIPEIAEAFALDLVDPTLVDEEGIATLEAEWEKESNERLRNARPPQIEDTVEELRRWFEHDYGSDGAEFDDEDDLSIDDYFEGDDELDPDSQEAKAAVLRLRGLMQRLGMESEDLESDTSFLDAGETIRNKGPRIGRNDPCPCGSGKKFKKCCGAAR
ncbi:MAG TPA: DUF1186 domain-containing protein [Pirellulaceae bacterium]|jgi:hypothetical protein|nr:DUF1186 domain-containing protein [Pirellulaceae bacterium]